MIGSARPHRVVTALVLLGLGYVAAATALHAQSTPAALTNDPLLAEVRGLRADLHQAAGASIRAQLLVARLQLQEQRINVLNVQLADVQRQLGAKESAVVPEAENVKQMEEAAQRGGSRDPDQQRELEGVLAMHRSTLAQMQRELAQLRTRQTELLNAIAGEQNRWSDFNTRLDELERQLPAR